MADQVASHPWGNLCLAARHFENSPQRLLKSLKLTDFHIGGYTRIFSCLTKLPHILVIGVQQLDIVKFALPLVKISFHPIFSAVGKHTNFFMSEQAASRPQLNKRLLTVLFG